MTRPSRKSSPAPKRQNAKTAPRPATVVPIPGSIAAVILCLFWGLFLSWMFWAPLWEGGGLIGGDLYPYYFPQKVVLHESLRQGEIPFWNPFVGFGYPVLGESQTAALYPPNLLLYRVLSVNVAYNVLQIGHYLFAFWGMVALTGRLGLGWPGRLLAATAFVYGWFPARICLEWAIIGGAWFVWILWAATAFLQTARPRYFVLLSLFFGLDLLAGHYNLAFITLLTLLPWPWLVRWNAASEASTTNAPVPGSRPHLLQLGGMWGAIVVGFLIAGVQLVPTWELKNVSQRQTVNDVFTPTYGHMPLLSMSQLWMPWAWSAGEQTMDEALAGLPLSVPNSTNQAEAQLYVGLIPFLLALIGVMWPRLRRGLPVAHPWGWLALIIVSLLFATGWPTAFLSTVPGINFFRGPGRYSMTAALAIVVLAGGVSDLILKRLSLNPLTHFCLVAVLLGVTAGDLWASSRQYQFFSGPYFGRQVFYASLLSDPPINHLPESTLRKFFTEQGGRARLYAPGQNIPSLLNVSAIPVYLGLGPEIYESDEIRVDFTKTDANDIADAMARLLRFGVTHLLLEQPLDTEIWPVKSLGRVVDPFLNRALARQEPFHFYEIPNSPGRISLSDTTGLEIAETKVHANSVAINLKGSGSGTLVLRDLHYPGWSVSGTSNPSETCDPLFRCQPVTLTGSADSPTTVTWTYRPSSLRTGFMLTLLGLALLTVPFAIPFLKTRREKPQSTTSM